MVVEAVFEKFDLKKEIFQKLDALCPPDVILASNTSTLSIKTFSVDNYSIHVVIIFPEAMIFLLGDDYRRDLGKGIILKYFS
jgi:hypothetical protein